MELLIHHMELRDWRSQSLSIRLLVELCQVSPYRESSLLEAGGWLACQEQDKNHLLEQMLSQNLTLFKPMYWWNNFIFKSKNYYWKMYLCGIVFIFNWQAQCHRGTLNWCLSADSLTWTSLDTLTLSELCYSVQSAMFIF